MAAEARLKHGNPLMCDYTPSGADVAAGKVVAVGDITAIAHSKIVDGTLGALAVGGGVYTVTAAGAYSAGTRVYWDDSANKVTTTLDSNKGFGYIAPGSSSGADGDLVDVIHSPFKDLDVS